MATIHEVTARLADARRDRGLSIADVARKAGINPGSWRGIEGGSRVAGMGTLRRVARVFGYRVEIRLVKGPPEEGAEQ